MKLIALILTVLYALFGNFNVVREESLSDIKGHWAETEIRFFLDKGVVSGYDDGTFQPQEHITRAQLAVIINKLKPCPKQSTARLTDLDDDAWYTKDVRSVIAAGYMSGYLNGTFAPQRIVTREEAVEALDLAFEPEGEIAPLTFTDTDEIQPWAAESISKFCSRGFISGYEDGTFDPTRGVTRAEIIKMIYKITQEGRTQ